MQLLRDSYLPRITSFLRKYVSHGRGKIRRLEEFLLDSKEERMREWRYGSLFHAERFKAPMETLELIRELYNSL